jgi:hypothetical protein
MYAQDGINYKALIKDNLGAVVANQTIDVRFTIIADTGPTTVYKETHTSATTDANGIVILTIGDGTTGDTFIDIDWGSDTHSLKVGIDIEQDASFVDLGTTQFMTVPYALHAKTVTQPTYNVNTFYPELGGYVIEINTDGTHGLVVAMQDQGLGTWYAANDLFSNAANHDTDGAKFKDWRMPTLRELNLMYNVYINGNGASLFGNYYWSSTEFDSGDAWRQNFASGNTNQFIKTISNFVRAVRVF